MSTGNTFGRLSRRQVLGGIAVGTASLAVSGIGRGRLVVAQEATPAAMASPGAAGISSESFGEADDQPLHQVERLEEDFFGGFKGFAERGEDFDARLARVHGKFQSGSRAGGKL